jgi:hypothetical protein
MRHLYSFLEMYDKYQRVGGKYIEVRRAMSILKVSKLNT